MRRRSLLDLGIAAALVVSGAAGASVVSGSSESVRGCVGKRDTLVSANAKGRCPRGSRVVRIGRVGPTGAQGATGATGQPGAAGADGTSPVPAVTLPGVTAAALGDSNTARNGPWGYPNRQYLPATAWFHLAAARTGQRVRLTNNFAVSGTRADEMLADQVPKVLALSPEPSVVTVMAGTNDVGQGRTAQQIIASLDAAYAALTDRGIVVIAGTILPSERWDTTELSTVSEVNQWIRARGGIEVADFNVTLSTASGAPEPGVLMDGTHISTVGAALMGRTVASILARMFPPVDIFPSQAANLLAGGTTALRADGVDATVGSGFAAGDTVVGLVEFETDLGADAMTRQVEASLSALGTESTAGTFIDTPGYDGPEVALTTVPRAGVLTTPPMVVPAGTDRLALTARVTGGEGSFRFGRVALVKVPHPLAPTAS